MHETKIYAVAGYPVMHSRSPKMFNAAFKALSVDAVYTRLAVTDAREITECMREIGIDGLNITSPFKEEIIQYLDMIEAEAERIGAVNTVVNKNGELQGFNTDGKGVRDAFVRNGISLAGMKAVVIGAGGAARAAVFGLLAEGAQVVVCNRTLERAEKIARDTGCRASSIASIDEEMRDVAILVSCLPEVSGRIVEPALLREGLVVLDANYGVETMLVRDARKQGCEIIDGREWLLFQGGYAFLHFAGISPPIRLMKEQIYGDVQEGKRNLALIGFMASGKTTVARALGERLDRLVIDIDREIEHSEGCTVDQLFAVRGEPVFRNLERESMARIKDLEGAVIACGGGAVLDGGNRAALKKNCHVTWLWAGTDTVLARTKGENGRPLLRGTDRKCIDRILKSRLPFYALTSDMIVRTDNRTATEVVERIGHENHFFFPH